MKKAQAESSLAVAACVDRLMPTLWALALDLHKHPELSGEEHEAQRKLVGFLRQSGFTCETGTAGIETAFVAWNGERRRPSVAFIAEYDALPDLGHACGHNLIGPAAVGAAAALVASCPELSGQVLVIGTPAEETSKLRVKQRMLDEGVLRDVDVAMMTHPSDRTTTMGRNLAVDAVSFRFAGKPAHASKYPHLGVSALDAAILTFTALEFLREHVRSDVRIHGIFSDGGLRPNIVPEHAALDYMIRAETRSYLDEIRPRVENCARAGALATGAEVHIEYEKGNDNKLLVPALSDILLAEAERFGADQIMEPEKELGSTDFGNVSHRMPSATLKVAFVPIGTPGHTRTWTEAASGERARKAIEVAAKAMAATGMRVLREPETLKRIVEEFVQVKKREG